LLRDTLGMFTHGNEQSGQGKRIITMNACMDSSPFASTSFHVDEVRLPTCIRSLMMPFSRGIGPWWAIRTPGSIRVHEL